MKRSVIADINNEQHPLLSTTTDLDSQQHKRSLEDYGFCGNFKRRRHLSPQNANINIISDPNVMSSPAMRKKIRTKSKNPSTCNSSLDIAHETTSIQDNPTTRKPSSRHASSSSSFQQFNELTLPNWERICPNIDQILSNKHTQSGVFAHEVQLVQQELEALLSMSIVRETIVKDLPPPPVNADYLRSKIRKHQEAERIYSAKNLSKKPLPPFVNHSHQRQTNASVLLDRQVTIAPILGARIDRIWSDVNNYYRTISSNDISTIENLVEFHRQLETKLDECQSQYRQTPDPSPLIEQLNGINYDQLIQIAQAPAVITHYLDHTRLGTFQAKLYEHIGQTSPVYRTPISSPMHGRFLPTNPDASLRISPRLHPHEHGNHRGGLFALPTAKQDDDVDAPSSSKSKKKNSKFISSPSSAIKFQQRLQFVQNYLIDQHLSSTDAVKRQLFSDVKSTKKRKISSCGVPLANAHDPPVDRLQSKLSTLISLVHECVSLTSSACTRARSQSTHEALWLKLSTIEQDIETFIEKLDAPAPLNNPTLATEKAFENLAQLLTDWQQSELDFDQQYKELFHHDQ